MDSAYEKFFREHTGNLKFKSKHDSHKSYSANDTNGNMEVDFEKRETARINACGDSRLRG